MIGTVPVEVIATPGHSHSHDGMCLLSLGRVIASDTLLISGCGRADFEPSDSGQLPESLKRLGSLLELRLLPAHHYDIHRVSMIGRKKETNRRLAITNAKEFAAVMAKVYLAPPLRILENLAANQKGQQ